MKRSRFNEEQIIGVLKEHEAGVKLGDLARRLGVSEGTLYRWKSKYGGMSVSEARRLRELEAENAKLKRLLALQGRTKRRRRLKRPRIPMAAPSRANERWSFDFVSDHLAGGRRFRVLNIADDYSRECVGQVVDTSISGQRVARYLDQLAITRGLPETLVCDNGPEFTSKAMFLWAQRTGVMLHFIQPGKPTQNAFIESFNGKFRDACLNQYWFEDLLEARRLIEAWRVHYNEVRPHSSLGYLPPAVFAKQAA